MLQKPANVKAGEPFEHEHSAHDRTYISRGTPLRSDGGVGQGTCFTVSLPFGTEHLPHDRIQANRLLTSTALSAAFYVEEAERWLPTESRRAEGAEEEVTSSASFPAQPASSIADPASSTTQPPSPTAQPASSTTQPASSAA